MKSNTILTLSDELLERYRSSIPRKAFEQFVEDITTGPAATAAPQIPCGGYICPHCESRLRAGETLPNQRPGQNDRPQTTKGAKP